MPSASPLLPAFPVFKSQLMLSRQKTAVPCLHRVCCSMPGDRQLRSCPPVADVLCHGLLGQTGRCWRISGQDPPRQSQGLALSARFLLCRMRQGEGVVVCCRVELCFEGSARFLFETGEGGKEGRRLFGFFYDLCFQCLYWNFWYNSYFLTPALPASKTEAYPNAFSSVSGDDKVTGSNQGLSRFYPPHLGFSFEHLGHKDSFGRNSGYQLIYIQRHDP